MQFYNIACIVLVANFCNAATHVHVVMESAAWLDQQKCEVKADSVRTHDYFVKMADDSGSSSNDLKQLAERKSRELYEIQEMRIEKLEHALEEKEKQILQVAEERQAVLKEYHHNLQLLEERDKQFAQFEAVITEVRSQLHAKNRCISDLKITIDRQKEKLSNCDAVLDQERKRLQKRLLEQKEQVEAYIRGKEESVSCVVSV